MRSPAAMPMEELPQEERVSSLSAGTVVYQASRRCFGSASTGSLCPSQNKIRVGGWAGARLRCCARANLPRRDERVRRLVPPAPARPALAGRLNPKRRQRQKKEGGMRALEAT